MAGYLPLGGGGGSGSSGAAIAEDMFFFDLQDRDIWTQANPSRLIAGIVCAVGSGTTFNYYMWDVQNTFWREADLIFQGSRGEKGDKGDKGEGGSGGDAIENIRMDEVDGTLSTTITTESGHSVSSIPIVLPSGDSIDTLSNAYANNQLITTLTTESGKEIASSPVTIEGGGGGGGVTIEEVHEIADEAESNAKNASLPKTGGTVSGDINFFPTGIGFNLGKDNKNRYKVTSNASNLITSYYDGSFHRVSEQHKDEYFNFLTQPKYKGDNLATQKYVDEHSGGGGGGGVTLSQVHEIADEAEANAKAASLPKAGGELLGDLLLIGTQDGAEFSLGENQDNKYSFTNFNNTLYITKTINKNSSLVATFNDLSFDFHSHPKFRGDELATQKYVDEHSGGGGGGGVTLSQVHEIADEAEANAKAASLPITGGDVLGESPSINLYADAFEPANDLNSIVRVGELRDDNPFGYMRYNTRTRVFALGTCRGDDVSVLQDFMYTTYWLQTVDFTRRPTYLTKNLATEEYVDDLVKFSAPDNTLVKIVDGQLVAAKALEVNGTIDASPSSLKLGAHKISSMGDGIGVTNLSTEQDRVLVYQDMTDGITKRPYVYKMTSTESTNQTNIPDNSGSITKAKQVMDGFVSEGYYIIEPNSIQFTFAEEQSDFVFSIYDFNQKVFKKEFKQTSSITATLAHDAIILDGVANISFSVTDLDEQPLALTGSETLDIQKFSFKMRTADRAYLAYEGEGGSGGEYPKNPTFETVELDMFAGSAANKNINFLSDDLTITNTEDEQGITLEGSHVTLKTGDANVVLNADELDMGFKEIINIQSGNKPASAVNLAQVESMLKNLFLQRVEVTLNDNTLSIDQQFAGKNVFVHGAGLNSKLTLDANDFENYQVVQITRSSDYENPAIPLLITEPDRGEIRFLVQGTTTFGVYNNKWLVLSDATVTLAEVSQRAGFQQYTQIRAGKGMTSGIDQFGVMTLDVVDNGGGTPSFDMPNNTVPIIEDKAPIASAITVENNLLVAPYGQKIAGHLLESHGEVLSLNNHCMVSQPIDMVGGYSNPLIFKEVDLEPPNTFITTNFHDEAIVHINGQEIIVASDDYTHIRTQANTIYFRSAKIVTGFEFQILDQHEALIYQYRTIAIFNNNSQIHILCPSLTLRANKSYTFIVNDLDGNPVALLGSGDVQAWVFDYCHLTQHELLTDQDSVLPDVVTFEHVKTLQVTDLTQTSGITFNSNGSLEIAGQVRMQNQHITDLSAAEHDHGATNLGQVKSLIANADFTGVISIDGQPVEDIQLNEDDFVYTYNEYTKVLHLNTKQSGGGGGGADGTVNPIVDGDLTSYLCEFATEDGTFIRNSYLTTQNIVDEHERIWHKLDPAYKTSITAQTEAATNTVSILHINNRKLPQIEKDIRHERLRISDLDSKIHINGAAIAETNRLLTGLADQHTALKREVQTQKTAIEGLGGQIEVIYDQVAEVETNQLSTSQSLTALETEVGVIQAFPLERMAAGNFEERLSIADSFDTLSSSSSHYVTPIGSEIEYHLPPDRRSKAPDYTIKLTVDGQTHEALKLTTTAIRAGMKPIKDVVDGVDAQDAATVNQLVPIHDAISKIHDRLNVIEEILGIISPPADEFPVYVGRMVEESTKDAAVIKGMGVVSGVTESTLLTTDYVVQGHVATPDLQFSYSVIAYPKGVVNPDPMFVVYNGLPKGSREHYELVIDGVMYIVLHNQYPDSSTNPISYKLAQ